MGNNSDELIFGDKVSGDNIPQQLRPLLGRVIEVYLESYGEALTAIYVHGSAVRGDWQPGKSDLDTVAFTSRPMPEEAYAQRRELIDGINKSQDLVTYVEAYVVDMSELSNGNRESSILTLAACGVCVWGKPIDFTRYLPSKREILDHFVRRKEDRIKKYKEGALDPSSTNNAVLLTRRYAKQGIRTLACIAVSRGALLHTGLTKQLEDIHEFAVEHLRLAVELQTLANSGEDNLDLAFALLEKSVGAYKSSVAKIGNPISTDMSV